MERDHKALGVAIGLWLSLSSLAATDKQQLKYQEKIFNNRNFSKLVCDAGLKQVEKKLDGETEMACADAMGQLQGVAIRVNPKGVKVRVHVYRDNKVTDDHTVEWDDTGKINYTEETNCRTTWYDFKKKKKHIETLILEDRRETREWYESGKLQSLSIEREGYPTQVVSWDKDGKLMTAFP